MKLSQRFTRFSLVGIFNTVFYIVLFNILVFDLGLSVGWANLLAVATSTCLSFVLNLRFVFALRQMDKLHSRFGAFVTANFISQFIVQQTLVIVFSRWLRAPGLAVHHLLGSLPWLKTFSQSAYVINTAVGLATAASLGISYFLYKKFVFKEEIRTWQQPFSADDRLKR